MVVTASFYAGEPKSSVFPKGIVRHPPGSNRLLHSHNACHVAPRGWPLRAALNEVKGLGGSVSSMSCRASSPVPCSE